MSRKDIPQISGRMDIHIHCGPDHCPRLLTKNEAVQEALVGGLRGIVLKSHQYETVGFAQSVHQHLDKWFAFGSYVMNSGFSSSSIRLVKQMIHDGARIIYLPTTESANHHRLTNRCGGFSMLYKGRLKPTIKELLAYIAETRTTLATGHVSRQEIDAVLESAKEYGISTVLIVHPEYHISYLSQEEQIAIRDAFPNVLFERTCYSVLTNDLKGVRNNRLDIHEAKLEELIENILVVGPEFSVLSSDLGQTFNPHPTQGFEDFLQIIHKRGISIQMLDWMTIANPIRVIGLWENYLQEVVRLEHERIATKYETSYREPLLAFADAGDLLFETLKQCVGVHHLLPSEILRGAESVISLFQPYSEKLVEKNAMGQAPAKAWCLAYTETNKLLDELTSSLKSVAERMGFASKKHSAFHHLSNSHDPNIDISFMTSRWSERHIAYVAGLGTFGLNNMIITSKGCAGRLSSLVTEMKLSPTHRPHGEYCLARQGVECRCCQKICPSGSFKHREFDYLKCWQYLVAQNYVSRENNMPIVNVCGKCMSGTPCSTRKPINETTL